MNSKISVFDMKRIFRHISRTINVNRNYLSQLDGQIGDSDHGTTMSEGFNAVIRASHDIQTDQANLSDIFTLAAHSFLNEVGATCGPLYASAFLSAANFVGTHETLPIEQFPELVLAIGQGIETRGKAKQGDKTMLDVWLPAAKFLRERFAIEDDTNDAMLACVPFVQQKVQATKTMIASKGRAAHLGERTLGHIDPGAMSASYILIAIIQTLTGTEHADVQES